MSIRTVGEWNSAEREASRGEDPTMWTWDDLDEDEREEEFYKQEQSRFYGEDFFEEVFCWNCHSHVWFSENLGCCYDASHDVDYRNGSDGHYE